MKRGGMTENGDHGHRYPPIHVLLCPDQPSRAFDNIATNIARFAGPNKISKLFMQDVIGNETQFF
jgi:hypothetical protein